MRGSRVALAVAATAVFAVPAASQTVMVGTVGSSGNCIPFGCSTGLGITRYQQIFNSSLFSGPLLINTLRFFNPFGGTYSSGTFTISLSTTSVAVANLSTNLSSNVGFNSQVFWTGYLSGSAANPLFNGTGFVYNPLAGNLLMDITFTPDYQDYGSSYFASQWPGNPNDVTSSRCYDGYPQWCNVGQEYLTTEISGTTVTPEPVTIALLGTGLAGIGAARRRKNRKSES